MFARSRLLLNLQGHLHKHGQSSSAFRSASTMSVARRGRIMNRPRLALIGSTAAATLVWLIPPKAECAAEGVEGNEDEEISKEVDAVEKVILNTVGPLLTKLGYGGVMGFFSGLAMKKVGQIAAFFVGIGFIAVQVLQHEGVIQVDFLEVKEKAIEVFDADGDGELTTKDLIIYWRKFKSILTHSLPGAGGFSGGFLLGVYYG